MDNTNSRHSFWRVLAGARTERVRLDHPRPAGHSGQTIIKGSAYYFLIRGFESRASNFCPHKNDGGVGAVQKLGCVSRFPMSSLNSLRMIWQQQREKSGESTSRLWIVDAGMWCERSPPSPTVQFTEKFRRLILQEKFGFVLRNLGTAKQSTQPVDV